MSVKQTKAQKKKAAEAAAVAANTPKNHFHVAATLLLGKKKRLIDFQVATESNTLKLADIAGLKQLAKQQLPEEEQPNVTEVVIQNIVFLGVMTQAEFEPQPQEKASA